MAKYSYIAKSLDGEERRGTMDADSEHGIARSLHQEGYILVEATLAGGKPKRLAIVLPVFGVPLKDKIFFCKNLQVMIAAGLSLPRALSILAVQAKNPQFRSALEQTRDEVTKGRSFSDSMAIHPDIFSDFFVSMAKVGEETGTLDRVLEISAKQMEKEYDLKTKIQGAMVYPAVIFCAMIGIGILMLATVVPQLAATFAELKTELPMTTKIVIGLGGFVSKYWWAVIAGFVAAVVGFMQLARLKSVKRLLDNIVLKIPVVAPIVMNVNAAYTVRNLSSLISSGVSLPRALEITAGTVGNVNYQLALNDVKERVKKGQKFSDAIKDYDNIYPSTAIQMIAVGEETGETSNILIKLAEFYENEVSEATKNLASVVEPFLMVIIGVVVGFFAVSMVQPMYSMLDAV